MGDLFSAGVLCGGRCFFLVGGGGRFTEGGPLFVSKITPPGGLPRRGFFFSAGRGPPSQIGAWHPGFFFFLGKAHVFVCLCANPFWFCPGGSDIRVGFLGFGVLEKFGPVWGHFPAIAKIVFWGIPFWVLSQNLAASRENSFLGYSSNSSPDWGQSRIFNISFIYPKITCKPDNLFRYTYLCKPFKLAEPLADTRSYRAYMPWAHDKSFFKEFCLVA